VRWLTARLRERLLGQIKGNAAKNVIVRHVNLATARSLMNEWNAELLKRVRGPKA
jgi:hypothetical protein